MQPYCVLFNMTMPESIIEELRKTVRPVSIEDVIENNLYDKVIAGVASPMIGFDDVWFERLPNLKLVAVFGVGTDKINLEKAKAHNVEITITRDILTSEVADLAFALTLAASRRILNADNFVRSGAWGKGDSFPLANSISDKRLGIVGLGAIGHAIGKRGEAFNMKPSYYNRTKKADVSWTYYNNVVELAKNSDVLIAAISATPETQKIINQDVLNALGPNGIFINIARGAVVDELALISALQEKRISSAGLDVFWSEPTINSAFFALDNVILIPHQGSATVETRHKMGLCVIDNIKAVLDNKPALTPVQ